MNNYRSHTTPPVCTPAGDESVINLDERQAAKFLGIGARTLWELRKNGSVPHVRFGKSVRYPKPLLVKWLMEQATTGVEEKIGASSYGGSATTASRVDGDDQVNQTIL
jgi:excisionase family DNA binding protein